MSGILHAEDNDFQTAQSYFLETIDADQPNEAPRATKYLLMCKVMQSLPEEIEILLSRGKSASGGGGPGKWKHDAGVEALRQVARAQENGSLREFETTLAQHKVELGSDPVVRAHLASLYDSMLERNLLRCVLPYSRVQVTYIAELVSLPVSRVEQKLSQMVLDGKISAVLDQGNGWLIVFEEKQQEKTYEHAIKTLTQMNLAVDSLYQKATQLP
jgi:26S proteasome regulatory subunit N6